MTFTLPTANSVPDPRGQGYGCVLDGIPLRLAPSSRQPVEVEFVAAEIPQAIRPDNPEEFTSQVGRAFSLSDTSGGAGLRNRHRRNARDDDPARYWRSFGTEVGVVRQGREQVIRQLAATMATTIPAATAQGSHIPIAAHPNGTKFAFADSTYDRIVYVTVNAPGVAPTVTTGTTFPVTTVGTHCAYLGEDLFVGCGVDGVYKEATNGTKTKINSARADSLWVAEGRIIIASTTGELREIPNPAVDATNLLGTVPTGGSWYAVASSGGALLAASRFAGEIHAFAPDDTGALQVRGVTTFPGEEILAIGDVQGVTLVASRSGGTSRLWAMAYDPGTGRLTGQVVWEWDTNFAIVHIGSSRDSAYVVQEDTTTGDAAVWRYDAPTGGMHRWWNLDLSMMSDPRGRGVAVTPGGNLLATFRDVSTNTSTLFTLAATPAPAGILVSPMADFFSPEDKSWVELVVDASAASPAAGTEVEVSYTTDPEAMDDLTHVNWVVAGTITEFTDGVVRIPLVGVRSRALALRVTLRSSTMAARPEVRYIAARALLADSDVLVRLPVVVTDWIEQPYKRPVRIPGMGEAIFKALLDRERDTVVLTTHTPPLTIRGQIESISTPSPIRARRGPAMMVSEVVVRGRTFDSSQLTPPFGDTSIGAISVINTNGTADRHSLTSGVLWEFSFEGRRVTPNGTLLTSAAAGAQTAEIWAEPGGPPIEVNPGSYGYLTVLYAPPWTIDYATVANFKTSASQDGPLTAVGVEGHWTGMVIAFATDWFDLTDISVAAGQPTTTISQPRNVYARDLPLDPAFVRFWAFDVWTPPGYGTDDITVTFLNEAPGVELLTLVLAKVTP